MPFALAIALGASLEFMTPLGYQTNLMVMGPGGYRYADFLRFGGPLTLLAAIVAVLGLCLRYDLAF
jgi:di/tricarboxylate transporter